MSNTYPFGLSYHTYVALHKLCNYLPFVPILMGTLAFIRIVLSRKKLYGKAFAVSGIVLGILSAGIYWASLVILLYMHWPV